MFPFPPFPLVDDALLQASLPRKKNNAIQFLKLFQNFPGKGAETGREGP
jgi:hypothetical protein